MTTITKTLLGVLAAGVVAAGAGLAFVYSGAYNIGADDHHTRPVFWLMETLRNRSIEAHAADVPVVPNLDDPKMIAEGAEHYAAMCTGCHLAPGKADSEIRPGLYPQPPNLAEHGVHDPKEAFWVIKHGIKMSAMPAWGSSHDDATIWNMVAFIRKMPQMTPAEYQQLVGNAGSEGEGHEHGHSHGEGEHHHNAQSTLEADGHQHSDAEAQPHEHGAGAEHQHADSEQAPHSHAAVAEAPISLDGLKAGAVPAAEAVANAFHTALQKGDRDAVLALLAPEAKISEAGHLQTRDEYAAEHLGKDIAGLKEAKLKPISIGSMPMGDAAMVGSETEITRVKDGAAVTKRSREMLTLGRSGTQWRITSVRWQSSKVSP